MGLPKLYTTEAIVLKRKELGEADSILTLYTPRLGKVRAVARGARRARSKMSGHIEPLTHTEVQIAQSRNLDIVTQGQTIESFLPLRDDLWRTSCALYLVELVDRFTAEGQENYAVFRLLLDTLGRLCQVRESEVLLRYFELRLLEYVGYRPQLQQCVSCNLPLDSRIRLFSPSGGGVFCARCGNQQSAAYPISVAALEALRFLQRSDFTAACRLRLDPGLSRELERHLQGYIRYLLEQEVKSVEWLNRLKSSPAS